MQSVVCVLSGEELATIQVQEDYWRISSSSSQFMRCRTEGVCKGGNDTSAYCKDNHDGRLCEVRHGGAYGTNTGNGLSSPMAMPGLELAHSRHVGSPWNPDMGGETPLPLPSCVFCLSCMDLQWCKKGFLLQGTTCVKCESERSLVYVPTFGIVFLSLVSTVVSGSLVVVCTKVGPGASVHSPCATAALCLVRPHMRLVLHGAERVYRGLASVLHCEWCGPCAPSRRLGWG